MDGKLIILVGVLIGTFVLSYFMAKLHFGDGTDDPFFF